MTARAGDTWDPEAPDRHWSYVYCPLHGYIEPLTQDQAVDLAYVHDECSVITNRALGVRP